MRIVFDATVTGSACESHVLQARVPHLPATVKTLLLDAGYDDGDLIRLCADYGVHVLAPLSKPIGVSLPQDRRDRANFLASEEDKLRYKQRACSIEPVFSTLKSLFHLDPLPVQGKTKASVFILLALFACNLIVLFNFLSDRPLGAVKSVLDLL